MPPLPARAWSLNSLELSELTGLPHRRHGAFHRQQPDRLYHRPAAARSSPYPSDVAKGIQAPIFHVNGDDPEAVVACGRASPPNSASAFKKDVVLDMFCYRRHGHNEGDEPAFTQPMMYRTIAAPPDDAADLCQAADRGRAWSPTGEVEAMAAGFIAELETQFEAAKSYRPNKADWLEGAWAGLEPASGDDRRGETGVADRGAARARTRARRCARTGFNLNPQARAPARRQARGDRDAASGIDWATAEALAFGTLCAEGTHVRLSGAGLRPRHLLAPPRGAGRSGDRSSAMSRSTMSASGQAPFEVVDSPLSEAGVLGFEYGYSLADPYALVLVGGAVRRFRQRRPGHHRPVHPPARRSGCA